MKNKDKWIIGIDLDGTVVSNSGHASYDTNDEKKEIIHPFTLKVIKYMNSIGHHIIIDTGRNWGRTKETYKTLGMEGYVINNAGAHIHHKRDAWAPEFIRGSSKELIDEIISHKLIKEKILFWMVEDTVTTYLKINKYVEQIENNKSYRRVKEFDGNYNFDPQCTIISLDVSVEEAIEIAKYFRKKYGKHLNIVNWGKTYGTIGLEINPFYPNKGTALLKLADELEIPRDNTMGIGDGENDYDLIKIPKVGVVMKNGCDYIREVSDLETKYTNVDGGVGYFLNEYFNLKLESEEE